MKIAFVYTSDFSVWRLRKSLLEALLHSGHTVYVICPPGNYISSIKSLGARYIPIKVNRFIDIVGDVKFLLRLFRIFQREKFDLIHNFTIKPNVYGAIAGRLARVQRIVGLVAGLGYAFSDDPRFKLRLLKSTALLYYKIGFSLTNKVWFQNPDDIKFMIAKKMIKEEKAVLIKGSGVNLKEFSMDVIDQVYLTKLREGLNISCNSKIIVMSARAQRSKGVLEFIQASRLVAQSYPDCVFLLMGLPAENSPEAIPEEYLKKMESDNFQFLGFRNDAREILALADIVTLPSYYREGIPRSLLEALSLGKPIVTTDNAGCRETVENNKNGFLVPAKDPLTLAHSIKRLLNDGMMRQQFGRYSRSKAEIEFSEQLVIEKIFTELYGFPFPFFYCT